MSRSRRFQPRLVADPESANGEAAAHSITLAASESAPSMSGKVLHDGPAIPPAAPPSTPDQTSAPTPGSGIANAGPHTGPTATLLVPPRALLNALPGFRDEHVETLRVILNHISEAVLMLDADGVISLANPAAEKLLGLSRYTLAGQRWVRHLCPPYASYYANLLEAWTCMQEPAAQRSHGPLEIRMLNAEGIELHVDVSLTNLPLSEQKYLVFMHDVSQHKRAHQELRRLTRTDHLTGLANRRAFDEVLNRRWEQAARDNSAVSLLMIDIDHFKRFNDEFGHQQGDYCLQRVAQVLADVARHRPDALAARYGGEEFALILPGIDAGNAREIARQLQKQLRQLAVLAAGDAVPVRVTVSQGIATKLPGVCMSPFSFLAAADNALYRAKSNGRNRVVVAMI